MTRRQFALKRLLPIALVTALAMLANKTCNRAEQMQATLVLDFGTAADRVRGVDGEIMVGTDRVGTFRREAQPGAHIGPCKFKIAVPGADALVKVVVELDSGESRLVERALRVDEGATITVPLEPDLR